MKLIKQSLKYFLENKLFALFISLIFLIILFPFLQNDKLGIYILAFLFTLIPLAGIYAFSKNKKHFRFALSLAIFFIIINWSSTLFEHQYFIILHHITMVIFLFFAFYVILSHIINARHITANIIFGSISAYLLLGLAWAGLFLLVQDFFPGSFINASIYADYLYYSFVTLTTLGYGDIIPLSPYARSLAILEAIAGVTYMAVIITRLVGMHSKS